MNKYPKYKMGFLEKFLMISIGLAIALFTFAAHVDALELRTYMEPTDAVITDVARAIKSDPDQTVTVMSYAAEWTNEAVGPSMKLNKKIQKKLRAAGVPEYKIIIGMANKSGLTYDGINRFDGQNIPPKDGVYLYLD